jgi:hypothetical protein
MGIVVSGTVLEAVRKTGNRLHDRPPGAIEWSRPLGNGDNKNGANELKWLRAIFFGETMVSVFAKAPRAVAFSV